MVVNEPASHGFVYFQIDQQPDLPLGTVIENEAAIFFDFNEPIITNTVVHTIGEQFIVTTAPTVYLPAVEVKVYPNPAVNYLQFELEGIAQPVGEVQIFDKLGRVVSVQAYRGSSFQLYELPETPGPYSWQLTVDGQPAAAGQFVRL